MKDHEIVAAMEAYGGSFVRALAQAYQMADDHNRARLSKAFSDYWSEYKELAELRAKRQADQC